MNESKTDKAADQPIAERNGDRPWQTERHSSWRAFWKFLTGFDRSKMAPYTAFRNSAGMLLSLALGTAVHVAFGGPAAGCGALFVSYSDGNDPYRHRATRMIAASVTMACAAFVGGISERYQFGVGIVAAAAAFVAGMAVAFGRTAADIGMMGLVMLTIFAGQQFTMKGLVESVVLALLGGLVQTALSVTFWPVRRYEPERRALAQLYLELGRTATEPVGPDDKPPATTHASQAQEALQSLRADSSEESERYLSLLNQAERARLCVVTLLQMQAALGRNGQQSSGSEALSRFLSLAGRALAAVGESLLSGTGKLPLHEQIAQVNDCIEQLRSKAVPKAPSQEDVTSNRILFQMDALAGQLRAAVELVAGPAPPGVALGGLSRPRSWRLSPDSVLATLGANLNFRSTVFRHAVRLTICLTTAGIIARATDWRRAYWIPMTVVLLLRPDFAGTFSRGLQRIAGTIVGLVLATAAFHFSPETVVVQAALIGSCVFLLRWLGPANYGLFAMGVTAAIVLMLALTGVAPKVLIQARAIDTLIGGVLALSVYALWPTPEPVEDALAELVAAYRDYFSEVVQRHLQPETDGTLRDDITADRVRLAARRARSNLEASVERLAAEPSTEANQIDAVRAMMASSHRLAHAIMVLEASETYNSSAPASPALERFAIDTQATLLGLERVLRGHSLAPAELPDLRHDFRVLLEAGDQDFQPNTLQAIEGDTIVNSVNTLREQILRWRERSQEADSLLHS
jgi:uncharacterized membrane protein YccC